jgi:DNA-binding transcriptional ArsR family regulator
MRYSETVAQRTDRWSAKTLDRLFQNDLSQGFGVPPLVAEVIVQRGREYYWESALHGALQPGQQRVLVVADTEPAGKPIRWCQLRTVVVTLDAGADDAEVLRREGRRALRRFRGCRLAEECCDQGGLASVEDLARLLGVTPRTVLRDLRWLREQDGVLVPTRGQQKDIGPSVSHRVKAVELYLRRTPFTEICQRLRHSTAAVRRYLTTFSQIVYLHRRDIPGANSRSSRRSVSWCVPRSDWSPST